MHEFTIEPLVGVGPVRFGMTRHEVEAHLGSGQEISANRHRYLSCLFVDYDDEGRAEFVEAARSPNVVLRFHGADLHSIGADEAVNAVSRVAPYDTSDPELGYSFVFPTLQVSLWRSTREREHFESVAAGRRGYFSEVARVQL